jgi:uncharacterized membrane protein YcaP (DUF421 family)
VTTIGERPTYLPRRRLTTALGRTPYHVVLRQAPVTRIVLSILAVLLVMADAFLLETPLWEIVARGTAVYLVVALVIRLIPKRHTGNISPNDLIALIIVGSLAADAIIGQADTILDVLLMAIVVLLWDYLFNVLEYYFPRFRRIAQDSPTLLIHNGELVKENLSKEKLTEQELAASLRKQGVADISRVKQAVLEVDGQISVVEKE